MTATGVSPVLNALHLKRLNDLIVGKEAPLRAKIELCSALLGEKKQTPVI